MFQTHFSRSMPAVSGNIWHNTPFRLIEIQNLVTWLFPANFGGHLALLKLHRLLWFTYRLYSPRQTQTAISNSNWTARNPPEWGNATDMGKVINRTIDTGKSPSSSINWRISQTIEVSPNRWKCLDEINLRNSVWVTERSCANEQYMGN